MPKDQLTFRFCRSLTAHTISATIHIYICIYIYVYIYIYYVYIYTYITQGDMYIYICMFIYLYIYILYIWPKWNNLHLVINSHVWRFTSPHCFYNFWELLGSFLCLRNHSGALLFLATQYVEKTFASSKDYSPLDMIKALQLRPSNQNKLFSLWNVFFVHRPLKK
jgi:hypothetical protein